MAAPLLRAPRRPRADPRCRHLRARRRPGNPPRTGGAGGGVVPRARGEVGRTAAGALPARRSGRAARPGPARCDGRPRRPGARAPGSRRPRRPGASGHGGLPRSGTRRHAVRRQPHREQHRRAGHRHPHPRPGAVLRQARAQALLRPGLRPPRATPAHDAVRRRTDPIGTRRSGSRVVAQAAGGRRGTPGRTGPQRGRPRRTAAGLDPRVLPGGRRDPCLVGTGLHLARRTSVRGSTAARRRRHLPRHRLRQVGHDERRRLGPRPLRPDPGAGALLGRAGPPQGHPSAGRAGARTDQRAGRRGRRGEAGRRRASWLA